MKRIFQRIRGVMGTALTWALGWGGLSAVFGILGGVPLRFMGMYALSGMVQGAIAGGSFALLLTVLERRHTLEELSLKRVAIWGGLGGLALACLPVAFGLPWAMILRPLIFDGLKGAGFAAGSVALARRASDTRLLEDGDDPMLGLEGE